MSSNGPFGFDPEEFDRVVREAGEGLRDALDGVGKFFSTSGERAGWANLVDEFTRYSRPKRQSSPPHTRARPATAYGRSIPSTATAVPISSRSIRPSWTRFAPTRTTRIRAERCGSCLTASRSVC